MATREENIKALADSLIKLSACVTLSDAVDSELGVGQGTAATPKAVKSAYDLANGKAPKAHASTATTYGIGTGSNYGHVKLSDSTSSTSAASAGIAASPKAVKAAYDLAAGKQDKLGYTPVKTVNGTAADNSGNVDTIRALMPDYSAGVEFTISTSGYTAPADGYIMGDFNASGDSTNANLYINGKVVGRDCNSGQAICYPVSKGNVIKVTTGTFLHSNYFYPVKGV